MAQFSLPLLSFFLFFFVFSSFVPFLPSSESSTDSDRVAELVNLRSHSDSGVIHLDDNSIRRFLTSSVTPRPYSLLIFFDAVHLHDNADLHLQSLRSEFNLLSSSFLSNNLDNPSNSKLFFCHLEFKESQSSFGLFGVNSLPHVRLVGPEVENLKNSVPMDQSNFARMAESMAEFVEAKTSLSIGPIVRPPILTRNKIAFLVVCFLISTPFLLKRILSGDTLLHDPKVWLSFAVFVYFFSVSGAMHNIIRKMPMFLSDRNDPSRLVFFYQGSGMQLGAEGFAIGFLYTIVGLLLGFVTHVLVRVRSRSMQRGFMVVAILVSFWAVRKVIYLDNWKTGYGIHGFWPSSWK